MHKAINYRIFQRVCRQFSTTNMNNYKVCVIGGAGGIGQPLCLLLKDNSYVTQLAVYDIKSVQGVTVDLSHIDTNCEVQGHQGPAELPKALYCADVVLIAGGAARKPGMKREDLFKVNANVVAEIVAACANVCPTALIAIITNPVNSNVPLAAEVLKKYDKYDPKRLFGVTTLDVVRTRTFIADLLQMNTDRVKVDVIGGHSGATILPIMSQCLPKVETDDDAVVNLVKRVQNAGTEVIKAKGDAGSATLSMAYAACKFTESLLKGLTNNGGATECSYVQSDVTDAPFFATPLTLGKRGVFKNLGLPKMNKEEEKALKEMMPALMEDINKGIEYGKQVKKVNFEEKLKQAEKEREKGKIKAGLQGMGKGKDKKKEKDKGKGTGKGKGNEKEKCKAKETNKGKEMEKGKEQCSKKGKEQKDKEEEYEYDKWAGE